MNQNNLETRYQDQYMDNLQLIFLFVLVPIPDYIDILIQILF